MDREVLVDARWLEPPLPIEQVLAALACLKPGQRVRFLVHREPVPLYGLLQEMGYRYSAHAQPDGCYEIFIESAGDAA